MKRPSSSWYRGRALLLAVSVLGVVLSSASRLRALDDGMLHRPLDEILGGYVDDSGKVAYRRLERESAAKLRDYLAGLSEVDPASLGRSARIAFWINAYNAHVINGVLNGYSAEGLLARKRFFSWYSFRLAGADRTLSEIEHEILRAEFDEPRIHFALVCASTSCPILRREAYRGAQLDEQLQDQARRFITDPARNRIGPGEVALSKIFDWFAEDFEKAAGSVVQYVRRYRPVPEAVEVSYLDYDWSMNAQPGQRPG